jgi:hypothetical protein
VGTVVTSGLGRAWAGLRPWLLAAGLTGFVELFVDVLRARTFAPGVTLSLFGMSTLAGGHLLIPAAALLVGLLSAAIGGGANASRARWWNTVAIPAAIFAAFISFPLLRAGQSLAAGAWISEQSFAPVVRVAPLVAGLFASPVLAVFGFREITTHKRTRQVLAIGLLGAASGAMIADHRVAPGLYPEFHMIAYAAGSLALLLGFRRALSAFDVDTERRAARTSALVLAIAMAVAPAAWFGASSRVRAELLLYSPVARDWIRTVMPQRKSTPLRNALESLDVAAGAVEGQRADVPRGLIPAARDMNVLLIVVDAMRSDAIPPARPVDGKPFASPGDTPFLDEWVAGTFRFSRCYAAATVTHLSMPSMMRSIQPFEDPEATGEALGTRVESLGYAPLAVVVEYFLASKYPEATALLDGFDDVVVYEKKDNDTMLPSTRKMLEERKGQRFFAWLHFYNLHDPGFDGELLSTRDGSRVQRYRRSLQWLDQQMGELVQTLEDLGLRDNTIIVLAADHGEGLGDHGQSLHGPTCFEHDVRVPLAIEVPGQAGGQIDDVVGNIDIVPTLVDLMGGAPGPEDRGASLVPYMAKAAGLWEPEDDLVLPSRDYYFRNRAGDTVGIVLGPDKLVLERDIDVAYRFDVLADPEERQNLHDPESAVDQDLMRRLMLFNPALVADELEDETTLAILGERLDEIDASAPGVALPFLLRVAALHPTKETAAGALRIFDETSDPSVRLLVLRHGFGMKRKAFEQRIGKWIAAEAGTPAELEIVAALARQGQPSVGGKVIVERVEDLAANGDGASWEPYLLLVRPWRKSAQYFEASFLQMLQRADQVGASPRVLELLLDNVESLRGDTHSDRRSLRAPTRTFIGHRDPRVRVAALRAIRSLADRDAMSDVRIVLADKREDLRVRREAASALAEVAGADAVADLVAVGDEPGLAMVVVRRLGSIGSSDAIPFLKGVEARHYNRFLRKAAAAAIESIRKSKRKKKPGGK